MFEHVMREIGDTVGVWLYVIAGALAFAEASFFVGFVLPGETALLIAGYFCRFGQLDLTTMIVVAIVCAVAGDSVGFEFGRALGPPLRRSRLGRFVGESRWATVDGFLRKHGGKAIFLARLTAVLRALMPSMAGMSRMRYRTFFVWNAAGGILWGAGCVLLGYAFASALDQVGQYLTWLPLGILAAVIAGYVLLHLRRRRKERAESDSTSETASSREQ